MNCEILNQIHSSDKIKIFEGLPEGQLDDILAHAQIHHYKKDKILFLEGEKVERFYIVLNGLIKLSVSDYDGNEAIIKISDAGSVCDVFSDIFPLGCQVLEDCDILTFPIEKFRKFTKAGGALLYNLLHELSQQNQDLVDHLSTLKLGNNKNKVGQFLLKNSLKEGRKVKETDLSYSKSQIASYLGMRLETFSRIIHQLKDEGEILIKKNKIILTEEKSLCKYCNDKIASECHLRDQAFCK